MYHIKQDKRSIQSGEWIYEALTKLMSKKDYKDIRVTEIVKEAGLGRATFYRNFDSKDDVLQYICDKTFQDFLECLINYQKKNSIKRSSEFLKPFLNFFDEHTLIVEQLIHANKQHMLSESLTRMLETFRPTYKKLIKEHEKTWVYFIAIRCGITINILLQWIKDGKKLHPEELSSLLFTKRFTVDQFM